MLSPQNEQTLQIIWPYQITYKIYIDFPKLSYGITYQITESHTNTSDVSKIEKVVSNHQ